MLWYDLTFDTIEFGGGRNGTTKFIVNGRPLRFQIPKSKILYGGVSSFKSITLETTDEFAYWWQNKLEPALCEGLVPFKSNLNGRNLRLKIDSSSHIFDSNRQIKFPEISEGVFANQTVTCIAEISGTYYFQDTYGLVCRVYQMLEHENLHETAAAEDTA